MYYSSFTRWFCGILTPINLFFGVGGLFHPWDRWDWPWICIANLLFAGIFGIDFVNNELKPRRKVFPRDY